MSATYDELLAEPCFACFKRCVATRGAVQLFLTASKLGAQSLGMRPDRCQPHELCEEHLELALESMEEEGVVGEHHEVYNQLQNELSRRGL